MRKIVGQAAIAVVLFALGYVAWNAGQLQSRVADAHEELAMLRYSAAEADYGDIEDSIGYVSHVPWVGDALLTDVRGDRATGDYWQARYDALTAKREGAEALIDRPANELA